VKVAPELKDFKNFLWMIWRHLLLPDPTPIQYDIADFMQNGPKRSVVEAFRGIGKSWICSAFVVHQLYLDPSKNIKADQRFSKIAFDVGPAPPAHAPSVKSLGITSMLTGSRADIIVADDIEVPNNSMTQGMRDKLDEQVKEFDAILKPDQNCRNKAYDSDLPPDPSKKIIFLGTPQCEDTIYSKLQKRGYTARIWPSQYPSHEKAHQLYDNSLAPYIVERITDDNIGHSTEPTRFPDTDLEERRLSYGNSGYALQYMLNPRLSDADRYPLKINDLIVTNIDSEFAPQKLIYAQTPDNEYRDLPCVGFNGDRFYRPESRVGDMIPYTGSVLAIDPSGRGRDETGYAVCKMLNGFIYTPECGGIKGGYEKPTLIELANIAKRNQVNKVIIEANMGDGMFTELLKPILNSIYPCGIEEVRHTRASGGKEQRVIDTLEPVLAQHKLVIDPQVIKHDYNTIQAYPVEQKASYSLFYQLSRITKDRGSLVHDDRLEALAMGVNYWVQAMAQDPEKKMQAHKKKLLDRELKDFVRMAQGRKKGQKKASWITL
jgi:hypothetical protein